MATYNSFEDLQIWQKARVFNKQLYSIFRGIDDRSNGFLKNHILKTSGSIMDNIAEGFEREGNKEFIQFLYYSKGSLGEIRSQLYRAFDNELIDSDKLQSLNELLDPINIELTYFIKYLKKSEFRGNKFKR
ncbi:MAG: hypothetical protein RL632_1341 [Bacteroidota bacterium]|jgi:four helix bundle protein